MNWQKFDVWETGTASVIDGDIAVVCPFELGAIATGKQRVFHAYFVQIQLPDGTAITGLDRHSVRAALYSTGDMLRERGLGLLAAGLLGDWYESGLSFNSGYGYLPTLHRAIHMMEMPPPRLRDDENDLFVEGLIREAIAGMLSSDRLRL